MTQTVVTGPVQAHPPALPSQRIERFLEQNPRLPTPFLVVDLDVVAEHYRRLRAALPRATVYYAVKANPDPAVLSLLIGLGCNLDVASLGEIDLCLRLGARAEQLSYGNTIKKEADLHRATRLGVATVTADCAAELDKIVRTAPASTVLIRLATNGSGADWPLSRKFGCTPQESLNLACRAARAGHRVGVGFHVGSQQHDVNAWDEPLATTAWIADCLAAQGIPLDVVNLGGGLPSSHLAPTPDVAAYGEAITAAIDRHLSPYPSIRYMVEPGRFLVGDAGVIRTEVVLVSRRDGEPRRWVYLDVGLFNGLTETAEEAIHYRIRCAERGSPAGLTERGTPTEPVVLAGPTCDSLDVLYERSSCELPLDLRAGDRLDLLATGAYTTTYSSVWFNGFEPLRAHHLPATGLSPAAAPHGSWS